MAMTSVWWSLQQRWTSKHASSGGGIPPAVLFPSQSELSVARTPDSYTALPVQVVFSSLCTHGGAHSDVSRAGVLGVGWTDMMQRVPAEPAVGYAGRNMLEDLYYQDNFSPLLLVRWGEQQEDALERSPWRSGQEDLLAAMEALALIPGCMPWGPVPCGRTLVCTLPGLSSVIWQNGSVPWPRVQHW